MKTFLIVVLAVVCTWFASQWLPTPPEIFKSSPTASLTVTLPPVSAPPALAPSPQPSLQPTPLEPSPQPILPSSPPQAIQPPKSEQPDIETEDSAIEDAEFDLYNMMNRIRMDSNIKPVAWNKYWHEKAREHSCYMAETGDFKHSTLNNFENIFKCTGYSIGEVAEEAFNSWLDSPRHRANIFESSISGCGIGIAEARGIIYVTYMAN